MRCDFCGSRMVQWRYPAEREWLACGKCHAAIEADDREALLDRAALIPVPRTVSDRYAPQFLARAQRLHVEFWETRSGPPEPLRTGRRPLAFARSVREGRAPRNLPEEAPMRPRLTYANVVSSLCLFLILGGGAAYAANTVFSSDIVDGEVKTPDLAAKAVTDAKLGDNSVATVKLRNNAVTGAKVLDKALSAADINGLFGPVRTVLSPSSGATLSTPVLIDTGTFTVSGNCTDTGVITSTLVINGGSPSYAVSSTDGLNLEATSGQNNLVFLTTPAQGRNQKGVTFTATSDSGDVLHGSAQLANKVQGDDCVYSVTGIGK